MKNEASKNHGNAWLYSPSLTKTGTKSQGSGQVSPGGTIRLRLSQEPVPVS